MSSFLRTTGLVLGGIAAGFALAHLVNSTERGRAFFASVNERTDEVVGAIKQGYQARTEAIYAALDERN
ncbi:hypothetical protein EG850_05695 [Gulosibacter macacae]|uniref:YtxH domain-containing protein n=1 Tax=Gulosibacter macacae TaxID=2488791 RepID=A0A3P3VYZ6_9MICO|nr:hypothetical protein [Gulosibacter macacae]RRJ87298.1 hypothetical protein EG850_05695 [Gulosibacter macacae]